MFLTNSYEIRQIKQNPNTSTTTTTKFGERTKRKIKKKAQPINWILRHNCRWGIYKYIQHKNNNNNNNYYERFIIFELTPNQLTNKRNRIDLIIFFSYIHTTKWIILVCIAYLCNFNDNELKWRILNFYYYYYYCYLQWLFIRSNKKNLIYGEY